MSDPESKRRFSRLLPAATLVGAFLGYMIVSYWVESTYTDRFWYGGRGDTLPLYATILGTFVGLITGITLDVCVRRDR